MSDQLAYEAVLAEVQAMADGAASMPKMPVEVFIHEALRLYDWAVKDRPAL